MNIKKIGLFVLLSLSVQQTRAAGWSLVVPTFGALALVYPAACWVNEYRIDQKYGRKSTYEAIGGKVFFYDCKVVDGEIRRKWQVNELVYSEKKFSQLYREAKRLEAERKKESRNMGGLPVVFNDE